MTITCPQLLEFYKNNKKDFAKYFKGNEDYKSILQQSFQQESKTQETQGRGPGSGLRLARHRHPREPAGGQ